MALNDEQRANRARGLGSSDATRIMAGDWRALWREKTGRARPRCLDYVPAVQIGVATESLHPRFYTRATGIPCYPAGPETRVHPEFPFILAHPDFLTWSERHGDMLMPADTVLEAKFHGGFKTDEELAEDHYWQLQHQMLVTGFARSVLSVLRPGSYGYLDVARDEADLSVLLESLHAFWWHVENDLEPEDPLAVPAPDLDAMTVIDMSLHNGFAVSAGTISATRRAVQAYREAEASLKAMMPAEARIAFVPPANDAGGGEARAERMAHTPRRAPEPRTSRSQAPARAQRASDEAGEAPGSGRLLEALKTLR